MNKEAKRFISALKKKLSPDKRKEIDLKIEAAKRALREDCKVTDEMLRRQVTI